MVALQGAAIGHDQAAQVLVLNHQVHHLLAKAHLATQSNDLRTHLLDHAHQPKGANMGLAHIQNLLRRSSGNKLVQHFAHQVAGVADLAPQLAI
jgi:hypothetical protein